MSNWHMGSPKDVEGECNAWLLLADDYHDNLCTVRCRLLAEHKGVHKEEFERDGQPVIITWYIDERKEEEERQRILAEEEEAERLAAETERAQDEEANDAE